MMLDQVKWKCGLLIEVVAASLYDRTILSSDLRFNE